MPTETTTNAAADVATSATPEGATPSTPVLTADQAREILRKSSTPSTKDADPLAEDPEGADPLLTHDEDREADPLGDHTLPEEKEEPAKESEAEPEGEKPADEAAEAEKVEPEKPEDEEAEDAPKGRKRVNIFRKNAAGEFVYDARERAAMQFADEEGIGVIAAYERLFGEMPGGPKKAEAEKPAEEPAKELTVTEITSQIAALRTQRKDAARGLDGEKANELTEQIEDLLDQKNAAMQRDAERGRVKQTEAQQAAAAQRTSMDAAIKLFPDSAKDGSLLNAALTIEIGRLEKVNPAFFRDPEWPEALTAKLASRLGIAPATVKPAETAKAPAAKPAEAKPAAKPTPKQAARPAPAPGGVSAAPAKATTQDFEARLSAARERNDAPAIRLLMREAGTLQTK